MISNISEEMLIDAIEIHWKLQLGSYFSKVHKLSGAVYNIGGRVTDYYWNYAGLIRAEKGKEQELIDEIIEFAKTHDRVPAVYLDPSASPENFDTFLKEAGFSPEDDEIWMFCNGEQPSMETNPNKLKIIQVENKKDMEAFIEVFDEAYEMLEEGEIESPYSLSLLDAFNLPPQEVTIEHYIGLIDKKPVTVGSIYMSADVAGLYNVGTLTSECKKGYGGTISRYVINRSKELKHRRLLLQTELGSDAERLYSKLGFYQAFSGAIWSQPDNE